MWCGNRSTDPSGLEVAIKEIDQKLLNPKVRVQSSQRDFDPQNHHPNIIRLYKSIETGDRIFLVLEYCSGGDLAEYTDLHGKVSEPVAKHFMRQLAFKLSKDGFLLLQFAPAAGVRQYDGSKETCFGFILLTSDDPLSYCAEVFSLSVSEIGTLVSIGPRESCEFFHDPNKGKSDEGKVRKVLKVEPLPDGFGHFFNLCKCI